VSTTYDPEDDGHLPSDYDGYDPRDDDYDAYLDDPEDYEAAQRRAEEPPEDYLLEEAERHAQIHRDQQHFGEECNCPPYVPPRCRWLRRLPHWSLRRRWCCGTPDGCAVSGCRSPQAAWRAHRLLHTAPF
jgi:hypothetical protein